MIYLNGQEILPTSGSRLRMPTGTVSFTTVATGNIGDAAVETVDFPGTGLVAGDNVLAVAVHQEHSGTTQSSSDVTFGLKLDAITTPTGGPSALIHRQAAANSRLRARIVRSPVMAMAAGFSAAIRSTTQSSARRSSRPK